MITPVISWKKGVSGDWTTASDWSTGNVPGAADQASLSAIGTYTVTSSANVSVYSLTTAAGATLDIAGGNFAALAGTGAGISAGKINVDAGASFEVGNASSTSTLDNTGTIRPNSGGALIFDGAVTLTGTGKVALSGGVVEGDLTNGGTLSNHGNTIMGSGSIGGDGGLTFDNISGKVDAIGPQTLASALVIDTGNFVTNTGTLEATAGGYLLIDDSVFNFNGTANGVVASSGVGSIVDLHCGYLDSGNVTIGAGATLMADGGASLPTEIVGQAVITDAGMLLATNGTSFTLSDVTVNATGGVIEASGPSTILLEGGININGGTLTTLNGGMIEVSTWAESGASFHGVTISAGSAVTVAESQLSLYGTMTNHGTIALNTVASGPAWLGIHGSVTLTGGGSVALSDSPSQDRDPGNEIFGAATTLSPATLTNVDNTISGAGTIGAFATTLRVVNQAHGIIDATGTNELSVHSANGMTNAGTLEATNPNGLAQTGGLDIQTAVNNSGNIIAQGNLVSVDGNLSGTGHVEIFGGGTVSLGGTATNGVIFEPGGSGALILKAAQGFSGNVSGFASTDTIDFSNFAFATTSITKVTNSGGGAAGSITNVTLTDSASHLSETLHLVNATAHEYGTSASDYSLTPDANVTMLGTAFHLQT
jgi:hypothetical protein